MNNQPLQRITTDEKILSGKPIIRGTRISVQVVLDALSTGMSREEIHQEYDISIEDIQACLLYASSLIKEEKVYHLH